MTKRTFLKLALLAAGAVVTGGMPVRAMEQSLVEALAGSVFIVTGATGRACLLKLEVFVPGASCKESVKGITLFGWFDGIPVYYDPCMPENEMLMARKGLPQPTGPVFVSQPVNNEQKET